MKSEAEKIRDFKVIACYACNKSNFDPHHIICVCSIKGVVDPMTCCDQFKSKRSNINDTR